MLRQSCSRGGLRIRGALGNSLRRGTHEGFHAYVTLVTVLFLEFEALMLDEAISLARLAVLELDSVNHAVAVEGVISPLAQYKQGVRSHAEEVTL